MGRAVHGASCPWGELSMGRAVFEVSCPWGEVSMGLVVMALFVMGRLLMGRLLMGRDSMGRVLMGRVLRESFMWLIWNFSIYMRTIYSCAQYSSVFIHWKRHNERSIKSVCLPFPLILLSSISSVLIIPVFLYVCVKPPVFNKSTDILWKKKWHDEDNCEQTYNIHEVKAWLRIRQ
jgi:hypothetical protein